MVSQQHNITGSQEKSIAALYPTYAPPEAETLIASNIHGSSPMWDALPPVMTPIGNYAGVVKSAFRMNGMRTLYAYSKRTKDWFKMIATGQVESTSFQPQTDHQFGETGFNDELYRVGGHPQNLGLTFKAPSVPDAIAQTAAWGRMRPAPRIVATIFTKRPHGVAKSLPAQSTNPFRQT